MGIPRSAVHVSVEGAPAPQAQAQPQASPKAVRFAASAPASVRSIPREILRRRSLCSPSSLSLQANGAAPNAYTYAAPASAQRAAISQPQATAVVPSKDLPTPGLRTFAHIPPNPRDPARNAAPAGRPHAQEVADIMEAIKRSLADVQPAPQAAAPAAASPSPASVSIPVSSPSHSAPASNADPVEQANKAIDAIEERFVNINYDFVFPSAPDFSPATSSAPVPELTFSPSNAPIHTYEHALNAFLTDLDAVDSAGDENVREKRRDVVERIEAKLVEVDEKKRAAWEKVRPSMPAPAEAAAVKAEEEVKGYDIEVPAEVEAKVLDEVEAVAKKASEPTAVPEPSAAVAAEEKAEVEAPSTPEPVATPAPSSSSYLPAPAASTSSYPPASTSSYPPASSSYPPTQSQDLVEDLQAPPSPSSASSDGDAEEHTPSTAGSSPFKSPLTSSFPVLSLKRLPGNRGNLFADRTMKNAFPQVWRRASIFRR